jgi:glycosyltransferase involved in cell wall biosynthesis
MRVLIFADHFAELSLRFAIALAEFADVRILLDEKNFRAECGLDFPTNARGLTVTFLKRRSAKVAIPQFLLTVLTFRPDIVQFEETSPVWLTTLIRIARFFAPVVLRVHDPMPHTGTDSDLLPAVLAGREWQRNHVDLAMLHGAFCLAAFKARYRAPTLETVHGPILIPAPAQNRAPEPGHLLMFGRMEAYKGLDILVEALLMLQSRGICPPVTFAGRGPELDRLKPQIAELTHAKVVDRFLLPAEVVDAFQRAEFIVIPYKDATQSGVVAAALANDRVMIASRVGGLPEAIREGETGLLVEPNNPGALAEAIERVVTDREFAAGLRRNLALAPPAGWSDIARDAFVAFEETIANRRSR